VLFRSSKDADRF